MRIFGRSKNAKAPAARRTSGAAAGSASSYAFALSPVVSPVSPASPASPAEHLAPLETLESLAHADDGNSDVFICRRSETPAGPSPEAGIDPAVTLFVYGWENVEPGPLSWVFPSLRAAL